jgi:hypothetical protein
MLNMFFYLFRYLSVDFCKDYLLYLENRRPFILLYRRHWLDVALDIHIYSIISRNCLPSEKITLELLWGQSRKAHMVLLLISSGLLDLGMFFFFSI